MDIGYHSQSFTAAQVLRGCHPVKVKNILRWYDHSAGTLNFQSVDFLHDSFLSPVVFQREFAPPLTFIGKRSMVAKCMNGDYRTDMSGQHVTDDRLRRFTSFSYQSVLLRNRPEIDIVDVPAHTPAFGLINLTYYRVILPVSTLCNARRLMTYCVPIHQTEQLMLLGDAHPVYH